MRKSVVIPVLLGLAVATAGCSNKKELEAKNQEIAELQSRVSKLESELANEKQRAEQLNQELDSALAEYQQKENVWLEKIDNMSVVTMSDAMLFSSGSVQLTQKATEVLDAIVGVIRQYPDREIRVEGHTDNVGIALEFQDRFKSNWELSTARATSVLHYLRRQADFDPQRMAAVGLGEYRPVAGNDTPEGRAANRRVVIRIGPKL
jgi:chemotaxis protein MotB